jgi:hypothetical protein
MIRDILRICIGVCAAVTAVVAVAAGDAPNNAPNSPTTDTHIPFRQLSERIVGTASKSVRFDWRKKEYGLALQAGQPVEYNNFDSVRLGTSLFFPSDLFNGRLALSKVFVVSTSSSRDLNRMPYRQLGRPSRWELEAGFFIPMAEGVVTIRPSFIPPAQMVFSLAADVRYFIYTESYRDESAGTIFKRIFKPILNDTERRKLEQTAPGSMRVDGARLATLVGGELHIYGSEGMFLSSKLMLALPLLFTEMPLHSDFSFGVGYAF